LCSCSFGGRNQEKASTPQGMKPCRGLSRGADHANQFKYQQKSSFFQADWSGHGFHPGVPNAGFAIAIVNIFQYKKQVVIFPQ
jgi:hypothetical protein